MASEDVKIIIGYEEFEDLNNKARKYEAIVEALERLETLHSLGIEVSSIISS